MTFGDVYTRVARVESSATPDSRGGIDWPEAFKALAEIEAGSVPEASAKPGPKEVALAFVAAEQYGGMWQSRLDEVCRQGRATALADAARILRRRTRRWRSASWWRMLKHAQGHPDLEGLWMGFAVDLSRECDYPGPNQPHTPTRRPYNYPLEHEWPYLTKKDMRGLATREAKCLRLKLHVASVVGGGPLGWREVSDELRGWVIEKSVTRAGGPLEKLGTGQWTYAEFRERVSREIGDLGPEVMIRLMHSGPDDSLAPEVAQWLTSAIRHGELAKREILVREEALLPWAAKFPELDRLLRQSGATWDDAELRNAMLASPFRVIPVEAASEPMGPPPRVAGERWASVASLKTRASGHGPIALSPDGSILAIGLEGGVDLWDWRTAKRVGRLAAGSEDLICLDFSMDGRHLAGGGEAGEAAYVWDLAKPSDVVKLAGPGRPVVGIAFLAKGRRLVTVSQDRAIRLWDLGARRAVASIPCPGGRPVGMALSADENTVAVPTQRGHTSVVDLVGKNVKAVFGVSAPGGSVAISPAGDRVALAVGGLRWIGLKLPLGRTGRMLSGYRTRCVAFSPNGKYVAVAGRRFGLGDGLAIASARESDVLVIDLASGRSVAAYQHRPGPEADAMSLSADGRLVAVRFANGDVCILETPAEFRTKEGPGAER